MMEGELGHHLQVDEMRLSVGPACRSTASTARAACLVHTA